MRLPIVLALLALSAPASAQRASLSRGDSALVGRILLAEDRRDSLDGALAEAARHASPQIRLLALRARGRIADPLFAARDSLPPLRAPIVWQPEPAWRLRFRALTPRTATCAALRDALADSAWAVRLHAADLVTPACSSDEQLIMTLREWIDSLPADAAHRTAGEVSWQAAAHGIVALARIHPDEARHRLRTLATHAQWQVRAYAARAAALVADTAQLRALASDRDDNVKEAAIGALSKLSGHADDRIYLTSLHASGAQAVRAAAQALAASPRADVRDSANVEFDRWVARANASARDARIALLAAAGRPASDDRPPPTRVELPPQAVALALGADVRLRVTIAAASGGGAFTVRLRGDAAPMMAARVLELVRAHYYDGLTWHRVEPDFVIQGGSPGASEYIGLPQFLRDELSTVPHLRGTVGMSTRGHDTGDAQWFVNVRDNTRLDRDYTLFAEVTDGIGVVDGILEGDAIESIREVASEPGRIRHHE